MGLDGIWTELSLKKQLKTMLVESSMNKWTDIYLFLVSIYSLRHFIASAEKNKFLYL